MGHLQLKGITKRFQQDVAVDQVDLEVNDGEFVVLVGPSGCGKSTTLRMIAGLETISEGELQLNGTRLNDTHSSKRNMAMVFQSYALYPHLSVFENIAFGMKVRRVPKSVIKQKVDEAARILQLEHLLKRKPRELSGGQNQRVALGRAIVREPQVFLMDEPLSNLDAQLRAHMRVEIKELQQRLKATMVYVTHDQVEAMTMGDKIVVMRAGKVQQIGSPIELYNRPQNRFVGEFIGSPPMNFIQGQVLQENHAVKLQVEDQYLSLPELSDSMKAKMGQAVIVGMRAENIRISHPDEAYTYPCRVKNIEILGGETLVFFQFGPETWTAKLAGQYPLVRESMIHIQLRPEHMHFFDAATEQRLEIEDEEERSQIKSMGEYDQ